MRIVVIGGSGHVGTFLIPRLVRAGHEVVSISRGQRSSSVTALGTITVASQGAGRGTTVSVRFPIQPNAVPAVSTFPPV